MRENGKLNSNLKLRKMLNFQLRNQQFQHMKEQKSYQKEPQEDQTNFIIKSLRFLHKISPLKFFEKNPQEVPVSKEEEELWRRKILQTWNVVDKVQNSSSSSQSEQQDNNDKKDYDRQEDQQFEQDSNEDEVQQMRIQMEKLLQAYQKSENEKKKLQQENMIMRRQLQGWLKRNPEEQRRFARIQGKIHFGLECDEVKVEKSSFLDLEEED